VCGLWGKTLLWGYSGVQHWQKINLNFFSCDTQLIAQVTHMPACQWEILLDNVSSRYTRNVLLVLYVYGNTPEVGHYWNKDPPEVEPRGFLFQFCPCSVGVAQDKAHSKFKKQGQPFCKMTWIAHHTVIWQVFHFMKCSSRHNVPSQTALNLVSTCCNMFQFPCRVDISSWRPLEL
jgi:hypothetical protein